MTTLRKRGRPRVTKTAKEKKEANRANCLKMRQKMLERGLKQVTIYCPISRVDELKSFAFNLCEEFENDRSLPS